MCEFDESFRHLLLYFYGMKERLQKFGFTEKEASVYFAALELGIASGVATIAKKSGVNRTTTYDVLESLVRRGVVVSYSHKKQRYYEAQPPEKLVEYLKEQSERYAELADEASEMLPELTTHYRALEGKPRVYFYEGEEGIKRVYEETLQAKGEIIACANTEVNNEYVFEYFSKYRKRRARAGIPILAIIPDGPDGRDIAAADKEELRTSHLIPADKFDFTPEVNVFNNKVMIADWKEKLGIIIESKEIAKVFRQMFELAFEAGGEYHKKLVGKKGAKKS